MAIFTKDNHIIYTFSNATNVLDESGFTKILVNLLIKCSTLKSHQKAFWKVSDSGNAGFIGFNTGDTIIIRTYLDLGKYSIQDTVTIGDCNPYPMVLDEPADLLIEYDKYARDTKITLDKNRYDGSPLSYLTALTLMFEKADNIIDYDDFKDSPLLKVNDIYDRYTDDKVTSIIEDSGFAPILMWLLATAKDLKPTEIWYYMNRNEDVCMRNSIDGIGISIHYPIEDEDLDEDVCEVCDASSTPEIFFSRPLIYISYNKSSGKIEINYKKNFSGLVDRLQLLRDTMYNSNAKIFKWNN